ncbi:MAG: hypothetical protein AB8B85_01025 [Paracoccaceae bacterium]
MKSRSFWAATAALAFVAILGACHPAHYGRGYDRGPYATSAPGTYERGVRRGARIENRADRRRDRVGNRVDRRQDRVEDRRDNRTDRRADRTDRRAERRANREAFCINNPDNRRCNRRVQ